MSHLKVVIFDLDGTLVDSMTAFAHLAATVIPHYYNLDQPTARRYYLETSGRPFLHQLEYLFPEHPANKKAAEDFEHQKRQIYLSKPLFTDVPETVQSLHTKELKVVVSSNNFQELVDEQIKRSGLHFDLVLGFRPNFEKGEAHFAHIAKTWRVNREEMIFVGDSLHDGERALQAGIRFIGKEGTFSHAAFQERFPRSPVIRHLSELNQLL